MKKFSIILIAMAMIAMTSCKKEKAEQAEQAKTSNSAPKTEQVEKNGPKISPDVKKAAPTADGKDHTLCEFNTKEYQLRLENLADGTFRLSMWKTGQDKSSTPDQVINCKKAAYQGETFVMDEGNGKKYLITSTPGQESIFIVQGDKFLYQGKGV